MKRKLVIYHQLHFFILLVLVAMAEENQPLELTEEQAAQPLDRPFGLVPGGSGSRAEPPKRHWPELVGLTPEEAQEKIKLDKPAAHFQVVPPDNFVTMDFNDRRVRLFLDVSGKVARAPQVG